ncbi:MAG: hypothetical protein U9P38_05670, partial [Campylobacterota bacterium]|nr:hypothetical protein [Campylobacterota bacterium]
EKVFNCFNSSVENITSKNDGILMFIKSNKLVVLLIELKSNNSKGYLKQLKAGRNFINYLLMQIDLFYSINVQKENVLFRGILFDTRVRKGTTQRVLHFEDRNGLICTTLGCNQRYKLQTISESIKIDYE